MLGLEETGVIGEEKGECFEGEEENAVEWNWDKKHVVINHPWGKTLETYDLTYPRLTRFLITCLRKDKLSCHLVR